MEKLFTEADQQRIQAAVAAAEQRTSGEIVPYVVPRSDRYEVATWRGAALGSLVAAAVVLVVLQLYRGWGLAWLHSAWGPVLVIVLAGLAGALLGTLWPAAKRRLAGADVMARAVHQRALQAFVEEEVFSTRDRTGILLFLSLLEHRIEVVGDTGINQIVKADEWAEVVTHVRDGIRRGEAAQGLVEAIEKCGHLLERRGVSIRPDDTDELSNRLRMRPDR